MSRRWFCTLTALLLLAGCAPAAVPSATPTPTTLPTPTASGTTTTPPPPATVRPTASASATPTPARTDGLVYFIVDTTRGFKLAREPRAGADASGEAALAAMIAGPADPDYTSPLPTGTRIESFTQAGDVITVALSEEARGANVGASLEGAMVQQIVWTITEAVDPGAKVLVTVGGEPASWGHLLWSDPIGRGDPLDERLMVSIDSLAEGATVTSPLRVSGEANVFEATLEWTVLRMTGSTAATGQAMTAGGQAFSPWEITLTLPAGTYMLEVTEPDPSGGLDTDPPDRDSRMFTVR